MDVDLTKVPFGHYRRKSSEAEERQILSLEAQQSENEKTIKAEKLTIVKDYAESKSAKTPLKRELFEQLVRDIEKGVIKGIFAWNPNRLSRNSVDTGRLIYLMDEGKLLVVKTPAQTFQNTPNDKFMLSLFCSTAKLENDNKGEDVKKGLKAKAGRGWLPNGAKPGYMNDPFAQRGSKTIKSDPIRFPIIKEAWHILLTGNYAPAQVMRIINEDLGYRSPKKKRIGGTPMVRSQIYTMFRDPFYYGLFEFPARSGNWCVGQHEKMITEDEFWKAQEILGRRGRPQPHKHTFAYTGMLRCGECGASITADRRIKVQKNGNSHLYIHYHCTHRKTDTKCKQGVVEVKELERQIVAALDELEIPQEFHDFAMAQMEKESSAEESNTDKIVVNLEKEIQRQQATIDGLIDMRARKEIDEEPYQRRLLAAKAEKARIQAFMRDPGGQGDDSNGKISDGLAFVEHAKAKFENGSPETKKAILSTLGSNLTLKDKKLNTDVEETLLPIKKLAKTVKTIHREVLTSGKLVNKKTFEDSYLKSPSMLLG